MSESSQLSRGSTWILGPGPAASGRSPARTELTCSRLTVAATSGRGSTAPLAYGGIPLELPVVSLGETLLRPTVLWRNMAAIATEEILRANPIDGVVLLGGCDKTIQSLLMAAASVDLPSVVVLGGPMLTGAFRGVSLGFGTDVWRLSKEVRHSLRGTVHALLDVPGRTLTLEVSEEELQCRRPNRPLSPALPIPFAAGSGSTSTTSSRPTRAPTSISLSAPVEIV
jgi:dihydroxyacid dehydratase/phosphogluconate dehydratase